MIHLFYDEPVDAREILLLKYFFVLFPVEMREGLGEVEGGMGEGVGVLGADTQAFGLRPVF